MEPETVFVSLYFAQVLRESCLCFRYGDASASGGAGQVPTQRGERERSPSTPTTQEQQQPTQGPQRFRMNSPEGGQGLFGGATASYASIPFFFRPTPSWLPPGRSTCSIACCKIGLIS